MYRHKGAFKWIFMLWMDKAFYFYMDDLASPNMPNQSFSGVESICWVRYSFFGLFQNSNCSNYSLEQGPGGLRNKHTHTPNPNMHVIVKSIQGLDWTCLFHQHLMFTMYTKTILNPKLFLNSRQREEALKPVSGFMAFYWFGKSKSSMV